MAHFNHFDLLAPYYDRFIKPTDVARFCDLAGLPVNGLLLDVGGGTGQKSHQFINLVTGLLVADSSVGMLSQAQKKTGVRTMRSEAERLPVIDGSFARVIMVDALHHVSDQHQTLSELWRVVKPGGRIVIEEPDIRTAAVKVMALIEKVALMRSHFLSPAEIAGYFNYPEAKVRVVVDGSTAWIIVDKKA